MLIKPKSPSLPRNLALGTFGELPVVFSTKVNLLYLLYSTARRCCLPHLINQNCLLKTFLRTLILMTLYLFTVPVFPSRTNLTLHNISVTLKMVKKVITNLNLAKASGPACISLMVLKNREPELSYFLAEILNKCLKVPCFQGCWKISGNV